MAIITFYKPGDAVLSISGNTAVNFLYTFTSAHLLRDALFSASVSGTFTLRLNGDSNTDQEFSLTAGAPYAHIINIGVTTGSYFEILNPSTTINYIFYYV